MAPSASGTEESVRPGARQRLTEACLAFEDAWRGGGRPRIEDVLERTRPFDRATLLSHLLRIEVRQRVLLGETPRRGEYAARFPSDRDTVGGLDWTPADGAAAPAPLAAGMRIAQFELIERLGAGGFGEVWRAIDLRLQRDVAVKVGHRGSPGDGLPDLLLHEARAAGRLRHAAIVPVHDTGVEGCLAYVVSDYVPGTTLERKLRGGALPPREAAELTRAIARALSHAHGRGVVHRDVKPSNVLLDLSGAPHLTDFGVARRGGGDVTISRDGEPLGSPAYMAPEQAAGASGEVGPRSDVYALGLVLYEMLAGRRAYPGHAAEALRDVLLGPPAPLRSIRPGLPPGLLAIVEVATARKPSDRYRTAALLADDLERFLRDDRPRAELFGSMRRLRRFLTRQAVPATGIVSATALAVFLLPTWFRPRDEASPRRVPQPPLAVQGVAPPPAHSAKRPVWIETSPPGAEVRLFPVDPATGRPGLRGMTVVERESARRVELSPGEYFVVAELPDGSFNETYRRVPFPGEDGALPDAPLAWTMREGIVVLSRIPIPKVHEPESLVELPAGEYVTAEGPGVPARRLWIGGFSMMATEFTVARLRKPGAVQRKDVRDRQPQGDDRAALLPYDQAVGVLEQEGYRMPFEWEWEYAARSSEPDWAVIERGAEGLSVEGLKDFGPVGVPAADRAGPGLRIFGLRSGAPEWTASWGSRLPWEPDPSSAGAARPGTLFGGDPGSQRVVRGGDDKVQQGSPVVRLAGRDPTLRPLVGRFDTARRIGFRGVRSVGPHRSPGDFVKDLGEARAVSVE